MVTQDRLINCILCSHRFSNMAAKSLFLATCLLAAMTTVYGIECYSGATISGSDFSTTLTGCTTCGSVSSSLFSITTVTRTCYTSSSCTSGCCSIDLCNSGTTLAPGGAMIGLLVAAIYMML